MDTASVLDHWADTIGMAPLKPRENALHGWGNMEIAFAVERDGDGYAVTREDRGRWTPIAWFTDPADADAFLLVCFGAIWRADQGLGDVFPVETAPGTDIIPVEGGYRVEANGRRARFVARSDAKPYTYVAGLDSRAVVDFLTA